MLRWCWWIVCGLQHGIRKRFKFTVWFSSFIVLLFGLLITLPGLETVSLDNFYIYSYRTSSSTTIYKAYLFNHCVILSGIKAKCSRSAFNNYFDIGSVTGASPISLELPPDTDSVVYKYKRKHNLKGSKKHHLEENSRNVFRRWEEYIASNIPNNPGSPIFSDSDMPIVASSPDPTLTSVLNDVSNNDQSDSKSSKDARFLPTNSGVDTTDESIDNNRSTVAQEVLVDYLQDLQYRLQTHKIIQVFVVCSSFFILAFMLIGFGYLDNLAERVFLIISFPISFVSSILWSISIFYLLREVNNILEILEQSNYGAPYILSSKQSHYYKSFSCVILAACYVNTFYTGWFLHRTIHPSKLE